jgi:pilus assembly protein CpaC
MAVRRRRLCPAAKPRRARSRHGRRGTAAGRAQRPTSEVLLSIGEGELITLPANVASVWTSNPAVADVYVANPRQIHLFGKEFGEATSCDHRHRARWSIRPTSA